MWFLLSLIILVTALLKDVYTFPEPAIMDPYGNPLMFMREKRTSISAYPHRTMMFTGYYRPIRRSNGDQATAVFAQGNSIKAGTYLKGDFQPNYLKPGPEPINETEQSNTNGEPVSQLDENLSLLNHQDQETRNPFQDEPQLNTESYRETTISTEETSHTEVPLKKNDTKKGKKIIRPVKEEDEEEYEDDDDDDLEETIPFVPMKGKRRYPFLNRHIFFPMMFGYPLGATRSDSSGSSGSVTAIANSYSTGKGGVANSVATAYGGSPQKKSRHPPTAED
ncbi:zinc finger homeobox protein 4-like [Leptopilina boulardi]|uniref:zinc finger homeobox protein 4-like n=1 Tax=Leptopilina boulardi TaxID=63433 RepID=UPI0021F5B3B7|nr:zinc finger homeobox protein 4-like [Leptopilina boulardi]